MAEVDALEEAEDGDAETWEGADGANGEELGWLTAGLEVTTYLFGEEGGGMLQVIPTLPASDGHAGMFVV